MINLNITYSGSELAFREVPLLESTLRAAVAYLERFVVFKGTVDLRVVAGSALSGGVAATGWGDSVYAGRIKGVGTFEPAILAESRNGTDKTQVSPDFQISFDAAQLKNLWWDPAIASGLTAKPPADRVDAFSLIVRELLHGMGVATARNPITGDLASGFQTVWDSMIVLNGRAATFTGPAVTALLGRPVEVTTNAGALSMVHLGNAGSEPWMQSSILSPVLPAGNRAMIGRLELAILKDLGWTMRETTVTDVVDRPDGRSAGLYMVGWGTSEQLLGGALGDRIEGGGGNDSIEGGAGNDLLKGDAGNDVIDAGAGNDSVVGGSGDDSLMGAAGNDTLDGGTGNDTLDGGTGDDTVVYAGARASYVVTPTATGWTVSSANDGTDTVTDVETLRFLDTTVVQLAGIKVAGAAGPDRLQGSGGNDSVDGGAGIDTFVCGGLRSAYSVTKTADGWVIASAAEGVDSLIGIERLKFSDTSLALDVDGVAGKAYRVYQAAFDRAPDLAGLGYWISEIDKGMSLKQVAQGFVNSAEYKSVYGASPTNAQIVSKMYENVLNRPGEAGGVAYWTDILSSRKGTVADVLAGFSESQENQLGLMGVMENGVAYQPYGG